MSRAFRLIRREGSDDRLTAQCRCGIVQTVNAKRFARGICRYCEQVDGVYARWQAELVAPFSEARALKTGKRAS